jgi:hypothetical protein
MNTKRRLLLAIPCLALAGGAAALIATVSDAPPMESALGAVTILAAAIGVQVWRLRHA